MHTRSVLIALAAGALSACTVGPNYRRPVIETPATFRGTPTAASQASLADAKWFEVFRDERLQEMVRTALVKNYDVRDAIVRVEAARANLGITRADQFPTVEAGAGVNSQRIAAGGAFPLPEGFDQTRTIGAVSLNLLSF